MKVTNWLVYTNLKYVYYILADVHGIIDTNKDIILCYLGDAELDEKTVRPVSFSLLKKKLYLLFLLLLKFCVILVKTEI